MSQPLGPLPDTELVFYLNHDTARWEEYRRRPAILSDGDLELYDADQMRAYAAQEVAAAVKAERERCAMVCELLPAPSSRSTCASVYESATMDCAAAIRAKDAP